MAKIQVQGIGVYDDKTLKKKIIQLATDLQKNAKKGDWSKASENGIRALGRMWQAYQDWSMQNESINEAGMELNKLKDAIKMFQKKIEKQGRVTNARDEEHLSNLIKLYNQMGGKGIKESITEAIKQVYHFKKFSNKDMDELDAMLSRAGIQGTPDFNKNTWTTSGKQTPAVVHKIMKKAGGKKIKESMNESPDADLGKKLKKIQNQIYKLGHQYKSKANVPAMMHSFMIGVKNQLKKDKLTESSLINERIKTAFMVHPEDPDKTERHWVKVFNELAQGHPSPIDYGPRETHMYDWNDRRNYDLAIDEYNKMMNKIANGLNKSLDQMNNIWKEWDKIYKKYLKKDGRK